MVTVIVSSSTATCFEMPVKVVDTAEETMKGDLGTLTSPALRSNYAVNSF